MEQISTKSKASLRSLLRVVGGTRIWLTIDKDTRTLRSKQYHVLSFFNDMHQGNDVSITGFTQIFHNVIIACYVVHLASGQTLLCQSIKTCTIRKYLKAASDLCIPFQMMNPNVDLQGKKSKFNKNIFH